MGIKVKSTAYPFGYDKNGAGNRNTKRFTKGFNEWADDLREALMPENQVMEVRLNEAKRLLGITVNK
jgi:hypothetical protein